MIHVSENYIEENSFSPKSELSLPYVAHMPYKVQISDISDAAKIYYAQITGLAVKYGYIFATDEQLAKMKSTSVRNIERWNLEIERAGFIRRETFNRPSRLSKEEKIEWKKVRKIYITDGFSNPNTRENSKKVTETLKNEEKNHQSNFKKISCLKNGGSVETAKNEGSLETAKNGGYNRYTVKEAQQTTAASPHVESGVAGVSCFDCLKDISIDESDKRWLTENRSESAVKHAIEYSKHVKPTTTLIQLLKWASKDLPDIPQPKTKVKPDSQRGKTKLLPSDDEYQKRRENMLKAIKFFKARLSVLGLRMYDHVNRVVIENDNIYYDDECFYERVDHCLKKLNIGEYKPKL